MKEQFYFADFEYFDGEALIEFDFIDYDKDKKVITLAVTNRGKISFLDFDVKEDKKGAYFEYGVNYARIDVEEDYL